MGKDQIFGMGWISTESPYLYNRAPYNDSHEMDYFNPMYFTNEYEILTRTRIIKNSSLIIDNIIRNLDGKVMVKASVTLVYMSNVDYKPTRIPDEYRDMIIQMEGDDIEVIEK
jgi:acyl-CoA thioesterase FadM